MFFFIYFLLLSLRGTKQSPRYALAFLFLRLYFGSIHLGIVPLNCRGGCYFCLDTKVTKKSSQQKGFFAALAFAHKAPKTLQGWKSFAVLPYLFVTLQAKVSYALSLRFRPWFCTLFPEALLLTVLTLEYFAERLAVHWR
ncbi:MAG TPA: hypothetical protein VIM55_12410 [Mucilaginibacter sp.]